MPSPARCVHAAPAPLPAFPSLCTPPSLGLGSPSAFTSARQALLASLSSPGSIPLHVPGFPTKGERCRPCPCGTDSSQWVLGCRFFRRPVLSCAWSVVLGDSLGAPVPPAHAPSEGDLSGCFAEGVTSNTSDSESSSSKCVCTCSPAPCMCVCPRVSVHVWALPSCLVPVVVLRLVLPAGDTEMLRPGRAGAGE